MMSLDHLVREGFARGTSLTSAPDQAARRIEQQGRGKWLVVPIDVNALAAAGRNGKTFPHEGYGMLFLAKLSHRGALLDLDINGNWSAFGPGDRFRSYFQGFTVRANPFSAWLSGVTAYVLIATTPDSFPEESNLVASQAQIPIDLLGTSVRNVNDVGLGGYAFTFVSVTEDTDPTLLTYGGQGTFEAHGFKRLRVTLDMQSGGVNATSCDVIPWLYLGSAAGSLGWAEQGTERIAIPDTDTSGGRYRVFTVPVSGRGLMTFSVRNLLAAARTAVGFNVQGVE